MTNNIPQIMTLSANNIFEYCEKKENNVSVKHLLQKQNFQKKLLKLSQDWFAYIFPKNNLCYPDVKLHLQMSILTGMIQKRENRTCQGVFGKENHYGIRKQT